VKHPTEWNFETFINCRIITFYSCYVFVHPQLFILFLNSTLKRNIVAFLILPRGIVIVKILFLTKETFPSCYFFCNLYFIFYFSFSTKQELFNSWIISEELFFSRLVITKCNCKLKGTNTIEVVSRSCFNLFNF
jgi:hypothetical protein